MPEHKEYMEGRKRELAKIHIAKKQLGIDDATYRTILLAVTGEESAAHLDARGRKAVLEHLEKLGFVPTRGKTPHPGQPRNMANGDRSPLLRKIEALLAQGQLPWAYADGIASRMYGVERVAWCKPRQLYVVAQALEVQARRKGMKKPR